MYHYPTAKGTASPLQPSDGMILVIGPRLEGHLARFFVVQTHLSCRFPLTVNFLGLRWSGSWSQAIDEVKDIRDKAEAMRLYARPAKDIELENMCAEIKLRAQVRLGEMSKGLETAERQRTDLHPTGGKQTKKATLKAAGISTSEAHLSTAA